MKPKTIPAGEFKAHCLRIMNEVAAKRQAVIITKRGKPVAQLVPASGPADDYFGSFRDGVKIHGDLTRPALTPKEWGDLWG